VLFLFSWTATRQLSGKPAPAALLLALLPGGPEGLLHPPLLVMKIRLFAKISVAGARAEGRKAGRLSKIVHQTARYHRLAWLFPAQFEEPNNAWLAEKLASMASRSKKGNCLPLAGPQHSLAARPQ